MFVDARTVESETRISTDLCIMGAGAAGITTALELARSDLRICLVESGGFDYEDRTQALYVGENVGQNYPDLDVGRLRMFGGTTNHWAGWCGPLDTFDFESRPWVPYTGWPFDRNHLDPYYERAQQYCQLGPYRYDIEYWIRETGLQLIDTYPGKIKSQILQGSPPTNFGVFYRQRIAQISNLTVLFHANVVEIESTPEADSITAIHVAVLDGARLTITAKYYVLALGGIENARILLLSNRHTPEGLGNEHDLVGRFFMDHPTAEGAILLPARRLPIESMTITDPNGNRAARYFQLGDDSLAANQLLNTKFVLIPASQYHISDAIASYHELRRDLQSWRLPDNFWVHIKNMIDEFDMIIEATSRKLLGHGLFGYSNDFSGYVIHGMMEQEPNPISRITLSEHTDALGLRQVRLNWKLGDRDKNNLWECYKIFASEIGRLHMGRVRVKTGDQRDRAVGELLGFSHHHIGATRAHIDPKMGVVDKDLRVHSINNLFVVGSSVFPTGGHIPPTLTIVALAIRLSDHLKQILGLSR